ncbi:MAG: N-acetylmuramoyl-L-alanine amidase [Firmicutes bacterium]|nr:N-acetylmuramoyl-L-alanine amidase [Bacillota bacterium]
MISLYILVIRRRVLVPIVLCLTWLAVFGLVLAGLLPERRVIVIDPGHGGIDGGTSSGDLLEKDVNLRMGHILREVLEARQYQVVMTRTDDSDVSHFVPNGASRYRRDLKGRVRLVGRVRPISLISIHVNWHKDSWRRGAIVYYQNGETDSRLLAEAIQEELNAIQPVKRQVRAADFYVLRNTNAPAVLVELGFISNPEDRRLMQDAAYLTKQAEAVRAGLEVFLRQIGLQDQSPRDGT